VKVTDTDTETETAAPAEPPGRLRRLTDGVQGLRVSGRGRLNERLLMVLGGIVAPIGVIVVLLGWWGAARTPNLYEQIPYLISGGLFGLALVFLGAFFYFAHWMTEVVKEQRVQTAAVTEALARLEATMGSGSNGHAAAAPRAAAGDPAGGGAEAAGLVATGRGTMAHRPDCVVVAGKRGLRPVSAGDGLAPCKLCDPYASAAVASA
jgi:multisubunit Na+/H+ antiporter MnhG subunit